jgi:UDP-3-O-[3-hydroxymyristoyl] N-acetylglucosamine deacetylase / 3-hydroxyacyl-[acyl-carrier-protein] dehydratase
MMNDFQKTLRQSYTFEGKGLHSGLKVTMTLSPAPINTGIVFVRKDLGDDVRVEALVDYVTHTQRGTTLEKNGVKVCTIEHVLSTFVGLGVDNAFIYLSSFEAPIMDGSAKPFAQAIIKDGLEEQSAPRKYFKINEKIYFKDEKTGAELTILPSEDYSIDLTIDYNSHIMGVQHASYDSASTDYATEIAPCRTFVFFHELAFLYKNNLIKGGDLENAIVIAEHEVPQDELDKMAELFNVRSIKRVPEGYLDNIALRFPNECARHKLLDVMGDFSLAGTRIKGKVIANKSGHKINTQVAGLIRKASLKNI